VRVLNLAAKRFIDGRAPPRGPHVAHCQGKISSTNRDDRETIDSRVGAVTLPQAPPGVQALDEADAELEFLPGGDIPQHEHGTLPAEGGFTCSAESAELDFSIYLGLDSHGLDSMAWDTNVPGQLDSGFTS
jgi:hypothetical protein